MRKRKKRNTRERASGRQSDGGRETSGSHREIARGEHWTGH
jgi:hypothetical protein